MSLHVSLFLKTKANNLSLDPLTLGFCVELRVCSRELNDPSDRSENVNTKSHKTQQEQCHGLNEQHTREDQ